MNNPKLSRMRLLFLSFYLLMIFGVSPIFARDTPFVAGERIVYKLYYNWNFVWLSAGEVIFEIKDEGDYYHIDVTGRTYPSYEWFYKVRDKYHRYIDKKTLLPVLYIRDIQQGSYIHYEKIEFDYINKRITSYTGRTMKEARPKVIPMPYHVYDLVSSMYFLRGINLNEFKSSKKVDFSLVLDNRIYDMDLICQKEHKNFSVKESGNFKVLECQGELISGGMFKEDTKMKVYVGDDENKLPLVIESPLAVGSVKAVLKSYENLKHPLTSKK